MDRMNHKPNELSGGRGNAWRLASAGQFPFDRAGGRPTGNLDSKTGEEIMALFANLHIKETRSFS